jgi:hypothetical protein
MPKNGVLRDYCRCHSRPMLSYHQNLRPRRYGFIDWGAMIKLGVFKQTPQELPPQFGFGPKNHDQGLDRTDVGFGLAELEPGHIQSFVRVYAVCADDA